MQLRWLLHHSQPTYVAANALITTAIALFPIATAASTARRAGRLPPAMPSSDRQCCWYLPRLAVGRVVRRD